MGARRFRHMRKKTGTVEATAPRLSTSIPEEGITPNWLLERLGFDPEHYWRDVESPRFLDAQVAVEMVAIAHADSDFHALLPAWDDAYDGEFEGKSFTGRLVAAAMQREKIDFPLSRSWFHEMYMDLARLDGALGVDLSSPEQLQHGVACYWKRIGLRSRTHARFLKAEMEAASVSTKGEEPSMPLKQLALF
jgi:hypothetical protein